MIEKPDKTPKKSTPPLPVTPTATKSHKNTKNPSSQRSTKQIDTREVIQSAKIARTSRQGMAGNYHDNQSTQGKKDRPGVQEVITDEELRPALNVDRMLKIMMATLADCKNIEYALQKYLQVQKLTSRHPNKPLPLPEAYCMILQYEKVFVRAYTQHTRYYILSTLWDQGVVKVGNLQEWHLCAQVHLGREQGQGEEEKGMGLQEGKERIGQNVELSVEWALLVESIEQQYYRQTITLDRLCQTLPQSEPINHYPQLCRLFQNFYLSLDRYKTGSVPLQSFLSQACPIPTSPSPVLLNKTLTNIHSYDPLNHKITNPRITGIPSLTLDNLMQLLHRIYINKYDASQSMDGQEWVYCLPASMEQSQTYAAVHYLLGKFRQIGESVRVEGEHRRVLREREERDRRGIQGEMDQIREVAGWVVRAGRVGGGLGVVGLGLGEGGSNKGPAIGEEGKKEVVLGDEKGEQTTEGKFRKTSATFINKLYETQQKTAPASQKQQEPDPYIPKTSTVKTAFTLPSSKSPLLSTPLLPTPSLASYDQLLRQRIHKQLQLVTVQRVRNKLKYYDTFYLSI